MPTKARRENVFIERLLSAYEAGSWATAQIDWLDQRIDGAVEALVARADGRTLAIEHTLIEPFIDDEKDFAQFEKALLDIKNDKTLLVLDGEFRSLCR